MSGAQQLPFAGPGKCGAIYVFASDWARLAPHIDWSPLICTKDAGHIDEHQSDDGCIWTENTP